MPQVLTNHLIWKHWGSGAGSQSSCFHSGSRNDITTAGKDSWGQRKSVSGLQVHAHTSTGFNTNLRTYGVLDSSESSFTWQSIVWHYSQVLSHILGLFSSSQTFGSHKQTATFVSSNCRESLGNAFHHPSHSEHPAFSSRPQPTRPWNNVHSFPLIPLW